MSNFKEPSSKWYPEIMYEEDESGVSSRIPFIMVPQNEKMPSLLYMFESRETGEFEPGLSGEPVPIIEMDLHQYADMLVLKKSLRPELYDEVRTCLGLMPIKEATVAGMGITDNIRKNIEEKTSN
jgi:hypothetical protein